MATLREVEFALADKMIEYRQDPEGFVAYAFPWGEPGALENHSGPDKWQAEFLADLGRACRERNFNGLDPVMPVRMAVSSGNGIGKGVLCAMIHWWIMSTRPDAQGTVTANTFVQLQTKTWATIQRWGKLCVTGHWFEIGSERIRHKAHPESWFSSAQSCREENSEAFAGQHAASSTSFYLFDEASAISDKIFEVADGGMTDGEPMQFRFGNPTRSSGAFHACCFGSERNIWNNRCIDSRDCKFSNKEYLRERLEACGEDSDWFRVHARGIPPRASDAQFIDNERVFEAQRRQVTVLPDEPLILGVDLARGGTDSNVLRYRRGLDARTIPPKVITGDKSRDSMFMVQTVAYEIESRKPDMVFLDETGGSVGGPIGDRLRQLGFKVTGIQFGGESPDSHYANMRAYMWAKLRDWLPKSAIDKSPQLEVDLTGPGYHADRQDRLVLESKESMKARNLDSPDHGDALALTFSQPVRLKRQVPAQYIPHGPATAWS